MPERLIDWYAQDQDGDPARRAVQRERAALQRLIDAITQAVEEQP